ncbi:Coenzyme F420 hydrogenase/dehydrogenase, beta subunit C-terminal domain [Gemmiger sp.]|uniref:Coenzyme F420 hydrogenase/dehydrogenase, beta subunit C-terminal domain n=1 Tax=Gemmiger sp. TaxID=2049027 RepID=UPI003F002FB2
MISYIKSTCCGCGACAFVCPKGAISMQPDEDGFVYPQVDEAKCVHCGLCEKVCAYRNQTPPLSLKEVYAAVSGDTDVRESASGGLFASFAQAVLADGGAVYGCAMEYENGKLWPRHICITEQQDLIRLKGSKYVQSDLGDSYRDIQRRLTDGKTVLFSGTPCQVAGLKGFLRKDYANLFTVDIVCHGVPSVKLFQDYIEFEEKKRGAKITSFHFRDKSQGWKLYGSMTLDNGRTVYFEPEESSYYQMFLNSYTYRENCYTCPYASDHRPGDITIGDYWCIELVHPELLAENSGPLDHEKGVSCMIVNNDHGQALLGTYGGGILRWPSTYEKASKYNHQLIGPSQLKPERETVLSLSRENYEKVEAWYRRRLIPIRINRAVRAMIPRSIKDIVKAALGRK